MTFNQFIAILWYTLKHKYFVTVECFKRGLYFRGIKHDIDKFGPSMLKAYGLFFHNADGSRKQIRNKTGYYKPEDTGSPLFDRAWFKHTRRNDHHWQYWALSTSEGEKILKMDCDAALEMYCDWIGAGKAQGTPNTIAWYEMNKDKLKLDTETRKYIEALVYGDFE